MTENTNQNDIAPIGPDTTGGKMQFTLPSGRIAEMQPFKGKHVREAQRFVAGDEDGTDKITFVLISMLVTIDNQPVVMEDLEEMDGFDVLALMGKFATPGQSLAKP